MKKKRTTILLIILALVVWGSVVFRIITYKPNNSPRYPAWNDSSQTISHNDLPDTFLIQANYPDPFLRPTTPRESNTPPHHTNTSRHSLTPQFTPPKTPVNEAWPEIIYSGYVEDGKKHTAIIRIGGRQYLLPGPTEIEGLKIIAITKDAIKIKRGSETRSFPKQ